MFTTIGFAIATLWALAFLSTIGNLFRKLLSDVLETRKEISTLKKEREVASKKHQETLEMLTEKHREFVKNAGTQWAFALFDPFYQERYTRPWA